MGEYQTTEDILKKWENADHKAETREIEKLRADVARARDIVQEAIARYKKKKLRELTRKAETENPWVELETYKSKKEIREAYGWDIINEATMNRLFKLWNAREESKSKSDYEDRVIEILQRSLQHCGEKEMEKIADFDEQEQRRRAEAEKVARENNERTYERRNGSNVYNE